MAKRMSKAEAAVASIDGELEFLAMILPFDEDGSVARDIKSAEEKRAALLSGPAATSQHPALY